MSCTHDNKVAVDSQSPPPPSAASTSSSHPSSLSSSPTATITSNIFLSPKTSAVAATLETPRKAKILCLHGFRTSGAILSMQTACMRYNLPNCDFDFVDGPILATGAPDPAVARFYGNMSYFEWFGDWSPLGFVGNTTTSAADTFAGSSNTTTNNNDNYNHADDAVAHMADCKSIENNQNFAIDVAAKLVLSYIANHGPYDGLLGFSLGSRVATHILHMFQYSPQVISSIGLNPCGDRPRFVISICGVVSQKDIPVEIGSIHTSSLHIIGEADSLAGRGEVLATLYADNSGSNNSGSSDSSDSNGSSSSSSSSKLIKNVMYFPEGHHIPSIKTHTYPKIRDFIDQNMYKIAR